MKLLITTHCKMTVCCHPGNSLVPCHHARVHTLLTRIIFAKYMNHECFVLFCFSLAMRCYCKKQGIP